MTSPIDMMAKLAMKQQADAKIGRALEELLAITNYRYDKVSAGQISLIVMEHLGIPSNERPRCARAVKRELLRRGVQYVRLAGAGTYRGVRIKGADNAIPRCYHCGAVRTK